MSKHGYEPKIEAARPRTETSDHVPPTPQSDQSTRSSQSILTVPLGNDYLHHDHDSGKLAKESALGCSITIYVSVTTFDLVGRGFSPFTGYGSAPKGLANVKKKKKPVVKSPKFSSAAMIWYGFARRFATHLSDEHSRSKHSRL